MAQPGRLTCEVCGHSTGNAVEQALGWANGVDVGLGASVWSADRDRAKEIAARREAGTVWIDGHGGIHPMIPFGGAKHSGYGVEGLSPSRSRG